MSEYSAVPSTGKLKLKGVKDSKIDKKKKKKKPKADEGPADDNNDDNLTDKSVVLKQLEDEDTKIEKESRRQMGVVDGKVVEPGAGERVDDVRDHLKTESEKRYDEQRRKRVSNPPKMLCDGERTETDVLGLPA